MIDIKDISRYFKECDDIAILTHANPDGDTLGAAFGLYYALTENGKRVKVLNEKPFPKKYLPIYDGYSYPDFQHKHVIAVDVADKKLLGGLEKEFDGCIELSIDHHQSSKEFAQLTYTDSKAASASEIVYQIILQTYGTVSDKAYVAIYSGVCTDTGCFKYSNTTVLSHEIAIEGIKRNIDLAELNARYFDSRTKSSLKIEGLAIEKAEYHLNDRVCVISFTKDEIQNITDNENDLDIVAPLSRSIEGVSVGIFIREKENGIIKMSIRTDGTVDASKISGKFGGGGHYRAAGCSYHGDILQAKQLVLKEVESAWKE